jgi:hypothetical protein
MEFEYIKSDFPFSEDSLNKLANRKIHSMTFQRCINIFGLTPAVNYYNKNFLKLKTSTLKYTLKINPIKIKLKNNNKNNDNIQFLNSLEKIITNININHKTQIEENFSKLNNNGIIIFNTAKNNNINNNSYKFNKNFNYGRLINYYNKIYLFQKISKIIIIQKHYLGYLTRRLLNQMVNDIIKQRLIKKLIYIQKNIRRFLTKKHYKQFIIIQFILNERKNYYRKIYKIQYKYHKNLLLKKSLIIDNILQNFIKKILKIQFFIKTFLTHKLAIKIINKNKNNFYITYPYYAKKSVQIKIFHNKSNNFIKNNTYFFLNDNFDLYNFIICPLRKIFILYIPFQNLTPGKYRCQLLVDGVLTCDGRFPFVECNKGQFYNIIKFMEFECDVEKYNSIKDKDDSDDFNVNNNENIDNIERSNNVNNNVNIENSFCLNNLKSDLLNNINFEVNDYRIKYNPKTGFQYL